MKLLFPILLLISLFYSLSSFGSYSDKMSLDDSTFIQNNEIIKEIKKAESAGNVIVVVANGRRYYLKNIEYDTKSTYLQGSVHSSSDIPEKTKKITELIVPKVEFVYGRIIRVYLVDLDIQQVKNGDSSTLRKGNNRREPRDKNDISWPYKKRIIVRHAFYYEYTGGKHAVLLNYERQFFCSNSDKFRVNALAGIGFGSKDIWWELGLNMILGENSGHFEFAAGVSSFNSYKNASPMAALGYRYDKPGGRFIFRFGVGWPSLTHAGFGFSF